MSKRKSAYAIVDQACDGGVSPNAYVPKITAEVRIHFPPNTVTQDQVFDAVVDATKKATDQVREHFAQLAELRQEDV